MADKAKLSLLGIDMNASPEAIAAQIAAMFKALTGREPTEAEREALIAEIRADLQGDPSS
jgi:hypothetical protein